MSPDVASHQYSGRVAESFRRALGTPNLPRTACFQTVSRLQTRLESLKTLCLSAALASAGFTWPVPDGSPLNPEYRTIGQSGCYTVNQRCFCCGDSWMAFLYSFPEKHVSFRRCTLAQQVGQFVNPVLQALRRLGGSAKPAQVCDEVARDMGLEGTATLEEKLSTGASRFANKIAWVRLYLVLTGYLDRSKRGVWTLTDKGMHAPKFSDSEVNELLLSIQRQSKKIRESDESTVEPSVDFEELDDNEETKSFTWKPIFSEITNRLLEFRESSQALVTLLSEMKTQSLPVSALLDRDAHGNELLLQEIDPFTFLGNFNRGVTDANRTAMFKFLKVKWDLKSPVPNDFDGIPFMNTLNSWFMPYQADRQPDHVDTLWQMFEHAMQLHRDSELDTQLFDRCLELSHVGIAYLTMGLFWTRPDRFAALDKNNLALAASSGIEPKRPKTGKDYVTWLKKVVECFGGDFSEFSYTAHRAAERPDTDKSPLASPYDLLFGDLSRANRVLDYFAKVFRTLGAGEIEPESRISIGISQWSGQRIRMRLIYAKWAVFGYRRKNGMRSYQIVLPGNHAQAVGLQETFEFQERIAGVTYVLGWIQDTEFERQYDALLPAITATLRVIREQFTHWKSSPYSASNRRALYALIVDTNSRALGLATPLEADGSECDDSFWQNDDEAARLEVAPSRIAEGLGPKRWWLNANPTQWNPAEVPIGTEEWYSVHGESGSLRRLPQAFQQARPGDALLIYITSPQRYLWGRGTITAGVAETDGEQIRFRLDESFANRLSLEKMKTEVGLSKCIPLVQPQGSLFPLTESQYSILLEMTSCRPEVSQIQSQPYGNEDAMRDLFMPAEKLDGIIRLLKKKQNVVLQGAPGTGKTFVARRIAWLLIEEMDESRTSMVQFHQSTTYEDFVQGYRPDGNGGFALKNGTFYEFCRRAMLEPTRAFVLIIDEINRGNLSKVFGELMMLIEPDKRDAAYALPLSYAASADETFFVPPNVYLIGTMNTADRSLSLVDYALRRRFAFVELDPGFDSIVFDATLQKRGASPELVAKIRTRMNALNHLIEGDPGNLGRGYRIGHSFFVPSSAMTADELWLDDIINFEIVPLIEEYWIDDPKKRSHALQIVRG